MRKVKGNIPDLRADHQEFTLEHCSVLLEQLVRVLKVSYGQDMSNIANQVDPESMRDDLLSIKSAQQLSILFSNPWGQPFLVGLFFGHFILEPKDRE